MVRLVGGRHRQHARRTLSCRMLTTAEACDFSCTGCAPFCSSVVPQALHEVRLPVRRLHVGALHQRRQRRASLQVKAAAAQQGREHEGAAPAGAASDDHVDELAGHDDHAAHRLVGDELLHALIAERRRAHRGLVAVDRHGDVPAQLARSPAPRARAYPARARAHRAPASARRSARPGARVPATARGRRAERWARARRTATSSASWRTARPCGLASSKRCTAFSSSITAAMAVLKLRRRPMSSVALARRWCVRRRSSRCASVSVATASGATAPAAGARKPRPTGGG